MHGKGSKTCMRTKHHLSRLWTLDFEALIDLLQVKQYLEMMWILARHPQEVTAWEDAYKKCVAHQSIVGAGLTVRIIEKFATEAMINLLSQPVSRGVQNQDEHSQPSGKPADKEVLRGYVEHMVEEKLAGQRKQSPHKTRPPRGGQGWTQILQLKKNVLFIGT